MSFAGLVIFTSYMNMNKGRQQEAQTSKEAQTFTEAQTSKRRKVGQINYILSNSNFKMKRFKSRNYDIAHFPGVLVWVEFHFCHLFLKL